MVSKASRYSQRWDGAPGICSRGIVPRPRSMTTTTPITELDTVQYIKAVSIIKVMITFSSSE